jgi:hypothetical protein
VVVPTAVFKVLSGITTIIIITFNAITINIAITNMNQNRLARETRTIWWISRM